MSIAVTEIEAKSILRKHKKIDSWFLSRYGMNLYRGCAHDCAYCDGRAERYRVQGTFGQDVAVKTNAIEILRRELDPKRKRKPFPRGYVCVGGGVGDGYQPAEKEHRLTRRALELIEAFDRPVHILTKSTLVERDLDVLERIDRKQQAIVSMSFSSVSDEASRIYERGCPPPSARLRTLQRCKERGLATGMFLLPVIPFVTDSRSMIEESLRQARDADMDFVIFGGMTLKSGRQKEFFFDVLNRHCPDLREQYDAIFPDNKWGNAHAGYYDRINRLFGDLARKYSMPERIPPRLYRDLIDQDDLVVVTLEHLDHVLKSRGRTSPYGYAAYSVSQLKVPVAEMRGRLQELKGVGPTTERIILDILDNGSSSYYESLI